MQSMTTTDSQNLAEPDQAPALSIVIPALNAGADLADTIGSLMSQTSSLTTELIVVDGGSSDGTPDLAAGLGASVIEAERGRGIQLAAGAAAATGSWLLFIHADTILAAGAVDAIEGFVTSSNKSHTAGVFRLAFASSERPAARLAAIANWRTRVLGLPYGDQGLLISIKFYRELGGFRAMPLMEDVDLVRRIGKRRLQVLGATVTTSAARYQKGGWIRRPLRNLVILSLYFLGVRPGTLARLYG